MPDDDTVHDREPESSAFTNFLRREKRLEHSLHRLGVHATPSVSDREMDLLLLDVDTDSNDALTGTDRCAALVTRFTRTCCNPPASPINGGTCLICSTIAIVAGKL